MRPRLARALLLGVVVAGYWVAGFFPFAFDPPYYVWNAAELEAQKLVLPGSGRAQTPAAPDWVPEVMAGRPFSIDLVACPLLDHQVGPARIFTVSLDPVSRNLTVAQDQGDLVLRLRRPGSTPNGMPAFRVERVFEGSACRRIAVAVDDGTLRIDVDGERALRAGLGPRPFAGWDPGFLAALGNELTGDRPWLGEIRQASVTLPDRQIDYLDSEAIELPLGWWHLPERFEPPQQVLRLAFAPWDWTLNLLGFAPLGVLLAAVFTPGASLARIALAGGLVSASIELVQPLFDGRYASPIDLALNAAGTAIGALVYRAVAARLRATERLRGRIRPRAFRAGQSPTTPCEGAEPCVKDEIPQGRTRPEG